MMIQKTDFSHSSIFLEFSYGFLLNAQHNRCLSSNADLQEVNLILISDVWAMMTSKKVKKSIEVSENDF
jgi:hypothetical protein